MYLAKFGMVGLPSGQGKSLYGIIWGNAVIFIIVLAPAQQGIVDEAADFKRLLKHLLLGVCRVETVFERYHTQARTPPSRTAFKKIEASSEQEGSQMYRIEKLEVPARIELAHRGFADRSLTTWARHRGETKLLERGKRETSLELATSTLGKLHSTPELLPH